MEYIKMSRNDLSKRICFWCNKQFGDYPCEPDDCLIDNCIKRLPTVERPRGEWISVEDRLPEENVAVLIWSGSISIAKLEKGITMAEREAMKRGEIDDPESEGWNLYSGWFWIKRSDSIRPCDEWGNNLKPYYWETVDGVGQYFGQDVKYWMPLPQEPEGDGKGEDKT